MITFLALGTHGRLGNQLFEYAALRALAVRKNWTPAIPEEAPKRDGQGVLLRNFRIPQAYRVTRAIIRKNTGRSTWVETDPRRFDPALDATVRDGDDILGHFENTRYFRDQWDAIKDDFRFEEKLDAQAEERIHSLKRARGLKTLVSIHIRRGDRTAQFQDSGLFGSDPRKLDPDSVYGKYLKRAMSHFQDAAFLVFTGGSTREGNARDVEWCRQNLAGSRFLHQTGFSDILDFAVMSKCDHNILSPCSTFSWWAAFLNTNPGRIAIAPREYLPAQSDPPDGFFPPSFTVI